MKTKEFLKKNYKSILSNLLIYLAIGLIISPFILDRGIGDLDELWNYNFARNFADGLVPYKDFSMVQTPLLPMILGTLLKIFPNELITMRVFAILLNAGIIFMLYKILEKLKVNKKLIAVALLLLITVIQDYFKIDYNFATLLVTLIIIYIELFRNEENLLQSNLKKDLVIGLLAGTAILFKQSTGIIIAIVAIFYKILLIRKKEDFKQFRDIAITRFLIMCLPIILMLFYFVVNGALNDFINYAISGVSTFSNKIPYIELIKSEDRLIKVISIPAPAILGISYFCSLMINDRKINTIVAYSIGAFAVVYPISDNIHFIIRTNTRINNMDICCK